MNAFFLFRRVKKYIPMLLLLLPLIGCAYKNAGAGSVTEIEFWSFPILLRRRVKRLLKRALSPLLKKSIPPLKYILRRSVLPTGLQKSKKRLSEKRFPI